MTSSEPSVAVLPETADIETASDGYAARFAGPVGAWLLAVQERITLSLLPEPITSREVLDVGGGHGQLAHPLCKRGVRVTVLGSDESCQKRIGDVIAAGQCRFTTGTVVALPFADRSFGVTLSFRLLPHCTAWPVLIRELCRTAGHSVIVDYPVKAGFNALAPALFGAKKKMEGNTRNWRMFTHAEVDAEFVKNGFTLQRREGQFFLPMVLHRIMKCPGLSAAVEAPFKVLGLTRRWGSPVIARYDRQKGKQQNIE